MFIHEQLVARKAEEYRERMEAASFTAWQMLRAKGLKKNWTQYRRALGLVPKNERKVDKAEKDKAVAAALSIDAEINRSRK